MSKTYLRGDLYYADLGHGIGSEQKGTRPVVIIQNNVGNKHSPTVIIAAVTSKANVKAKLPTHYYLDAGNGLVQPSLVLLEQIPYCGQATVVWLHRQTGRGTYPGYQPRSGHQHRPDKPPIPKQLKLCLCGACADAFRGTGAFNSAGKPYRVQAEKMRSASTVDSAPA